MNPVAKRSPTKAALTRGSLHNADALLRRYPGGNTLGSGAGTGPLGPEDETPVADKRETDL
jgi:hypothetical protein